MNPKPASVEQAPSCLSCGYCLIGSVSDRCPECGSVVRKANVVYLPWERAWQSNGFIRFLRTICVVTVRPHRFLQDVRQRKDISIRRAGSFLLFAIGAALGLAVAAPVLTMIVSVFYHTGAFLLSCKEAYVVLWKFGHIASVPGILWPAVDLFNAVVICSFALRYAEGRVRQSALGLTDFWVMLSALFLPLFVFRLFLGSLSVFLLSRSVPWAASVNGYAPEVMIVLYTAVLFFVGVITFGINRLKMLVASVVCAITLRILLSITARIVVAAFLLLYDAPGLG